MHLLCSKSRINSISKSNTVPRLELEAALLLSKLVARVYRTLKVKLNINNVYLFADSQICLAWLNTQLTRLQAYVANRVKIIKELTGEFVWLYVNTKDNPSDLISRGVSPQDLAACKMWFFGPEFLHDSEYTFKCILNIPNDLPEVKPAPMLASHVTSAEKSVPDNIFERLRKYSSIHKMTRVLAYVLRFCNNIKTEKPRLHTDFLSSNELHQALMLIIKYEQSNQFKDEIHSLHKGQSVKGKLISLNPFIDKTGLLRVGGRLHHSNIPYLQKHPIILPKNSIITKLIITSEHLKLLHKGPTLVLTNLSQRYWIINGLNEVKKITQKCITCFKQKAIAAKQLMGSLPAERVTATTRAFIKVGMDFAGPINVKLSRSQMSRPRYPDVPSGQ
ncbi:uncharacterized protein LOC125233498 [Leguminivora glycinivorella]|uniref:uncharacterized protein LOC125233498 n=1 Tax=Leguminivora glycinivorella TaxID=1035111 RepID=UPI00200C5AEB|nr:uncharacterized protein LOC125233498 [Leguminivora glycinivorella]